MPVFPEKVSLFSDPEMKLRRTRPQHKTIFDNIKRKYKPPVILCR